MPDGIKLLSPSTSASSVRINPPSDVQSFGEQPFTFGAVGESFDDPITLEVCVHWPH